MNAHCADAVINKRIIRYPAIRRFIDRNAIIGIVSYDTTVNRW
jgi:hypothetical protein